MKSGGSKNGGSRWLCLSVLANNQSVLYVGGAADWSVQIQVNYLSVF